MVALIAVMAQVGSYVPATSVKINLLILSLQGWEVRDFLYQRTQPLTCSSSL